MLDEEIGEIDRHTTEWEILHWMSREPIDLLGQGQIHRVDEIDQTEERKETRGTEIGLGIDALKADLFPVGSRGGMETCRGIEQSTVDGVENT